MTLSEPWQTAEIPGPVRAFSIVKPEVAVSAIKRSKRPILIVGHEAVEMELEDAKPIDYAIRIAESTGAQVVATAHIVGEFLKREFSKVYWMSILDIANRLRDPGWGGLDGQGQYDLALFLGIPYYMGWVTLSGLKHFAPHLKTLSMDRFHQPHATWSFPNIPAKDWQQQLEVIATQLQG
ncbi:MAG: CO dehydrogenase/acetyl-CoA synthase complex subunit epsilon [Candidatus Bathyarchaeia archaeon]